MKHSDSLELSLPINIPVVHDLRKTLANPVLGIGETEVINLGWRWWDRTTLPGRVS
jgi:hypothetical protein